MLTLYEAFLTRRFAPTTVRLRMFWIRKFASAHDVETANTDDLYDYLESNPEWTPNTKQTIISTLRGFYKWGVSSGHLESNVALDLVRVRVPRRPSRIATDDVILDGIGNSTLPEEAMLRLGAEGGLRVAEIARLQTADRDGEWLTVAGKGGTIRTVHLQDELLEVLRVLERTTARWGYYFPGRPHEPVAPSTVWRHVRALTGLNTHALRHRAGTSVYRNTGYDLRLAQEFLGHSSPTTTAIYVHVDREDMSRASLATRLRRAA